MSFPHGQFNQGGIDCCHTGCLGDLVSGLEMGSGMGLSIGLLGDPEWDI